MSHHLANRFLFKILLGIAIYLYYARADDECPNAKMKQPELAASALMPRSILNARLYSQIDRQVDGRHI